MKRFKILMVAVAPMVIWFPSVACAFSITKIADTNTPVPGGSGTFTKFDISSGYVFLADGSGGQQGIYSYGLSVIADTHTGAPGFGAGVHFTQFSAVSDGIENATFVATTSTGQQAVYQQFYYAPTLLLIAQTGQSPSTGVTFGHFTSASSTFQFDPNEDLYPMGEFLSDAGIYSFVVNSTVPDYSTYSVSFAQQATTTPPSDFASLGQPNLKDGWAGGVIAGHDSSIQTMRAVANGVEGIYASIGGVGYLPSPFTKLVDTATPSIVQFTSFGDPTAGIDNLVFTAHYNDGAVDRQGIFGWGPYYYFDPSKGLVPMLKELLATGTVAPDSGGAHFMDFLRATPKGTFLADLDNGTQGIYSLANLNGSNSTETIHDIIDTTDMLNGKSIQSFEMSREADMFPNPDGTAFIVNFTDGSQGLYYFTVPEPTWLGWALLPLLMIRRKRST